MKPNLRDFFTGLFTAAIEAADPDHILAGQLPDPPKGRTIIIGAGKGAAQLAAAFERQWHTPCNGLVVTRYGYGCSTRHIKIIEASHPVPDAAGLAASQALFNLVGDLGPDDLVVALITGGGSALLPAPPKGLSLKDEQQLNEILLACGAPIQALNAIRKHISQIKGGRLAQAVHPARLVSLIVSDVPGDDPAQIASGPTVADDVGPHKALNYLAQYNIKLPAKLRAHLESPQAKAPDPRDPIFARNEVRVIASAGLSLEAAAKAARAQGVAAVILSDALEGEASEAGRFHAAIAKEIARRDRPFAKPVLLLSGGETSVTLRNKDGKGGRNSEFLLSFACEIDDVTGISALAADTDGIDGSEANAGAFADGQSAARMRAAGLDPAFMLRNNDSWTAFNAIGDLFSPGPTGTNVNDFRAILVGDLPR